MATQNTQETSTQRTQSTQSPADRSSSPNMSTAGTSTTAQADRERPMPTSREDVRNAGMIPNQSSSRMQPWAGHVTPFSFMHRLAEDMDRLFSNLGFGSPIAPLGGPLSDPLGRDLWTEPLLSDTMRWSPQIELFRRGDELVVRADLPGMSKDSISIEALDHALALRGERRQELHDDRSGSYWNERSYGVFQRTIPLPEGANVDQARAEFHDGVLEVTIPAPRQVPRGRNIPIH